jgi:hypothetical protein
VTVHCRAWKLASRFRPIAGSATATTVESIPATDDPKIIAATTHRPCAER